MITKRNKNKIIKILGKHYTKDVLAVLKAQNKLNTKGESYTANDVRKVVGGFEENSVIENAVLDACVKEQQKQKLISTKKNKVLNKKLAS